MPADRGRLQRVAQTLVAPDAELVHLGTGGFASTFMVTDADGATVALKIVDPARSITERVDRELAALERVEHPNVVRYRRHGEVTFDGDSFRWIEMDFVQGQSLASALRGGVQYSTVEVANMFHRLVQGAAAIWAQETAHRDLSPNNILVTPDAQLVIVDLGMARHVDDATITLLPTPGTPGWMSPEQVGPNPAHGDWRSDQFVLGLLGYALLTGTAPFVARTPMELWVAPGNVSPRPIRAVAPNVPAVIADIVERMLARQPHRRYLKPDSLLNDLERAVAALSVDVPANSGTVDFYLEISQIKTFGADGFISQLAPAGVIIDARARARVSEFCAAAQDAKSLAIIDPVTTFARSPLVARPAFYKKLVHGEDATLSGFKDDNARRAWIEPILEAYSAENPDVLIAPYFYSGDGEGNWIDESLASGRIARQIVAEQGAPTRVWTALSLSSNWLARDGDRDQLLAKVTGQTHDALFLLTHTAQESFAPIRDVAVLRGFQDVIAVMNEAQVPVIVGRRASSGLLLLAMGASGWSTGVNANLMNSAPHPESESKGGPPLDHVYVPQLLNYINATSYIQMLGARPDLVGLTTSAGAALLYRNPTLEEITKAERILLLHHNISAVKEQVDAIASQPTHDRVTHMRELILHAQAAYQQLPHVRPGEDSSFLTAWLQVI